MKDDPTDFVDSWWYRLSLDALKAQEHRRKNWQFLCRPSEPWKASPGAGRIRLREKPDRYQESE